MRPVIPGLGKPVPGPLTPTIEPRPSSRTSGDHAAVKREESEQRPQGAHLFRRVLAGGFLLGRFRHAIVTLGDFDQNAPGFSLCELLGHHPRVFTASPPVLGVVQPSCWQVCLPVARVTNSSCERRRPLGFLAVEARCECLTLLIVRKLNRDVDCISVLIINEPSRLVSMAIEPFAHRRHLVSKIRGAYSNSNSAHSNPLSVGAPRDRGKRLYVLKIPASNLIWIRAIRVSRCVGMVNRTALFRRDGRRFLLSRPSKPSPALGRHDVATRFGSVAPLAGARL
jgi:hypothetical protein